MADTVRIYWTATQIPGGETLYTCRVEGDGFGWSIFKEWNRDEFFARYNALSVTKEPPSEAELTEEDKTNIAYTVGYLKEACQLIDEINGTKEPAKEV